MNPPTVESTVAGLERVSLPTAEQLSLWPEFEFVVPAIHNSRIDHRFSKVLNHGVAKLLGYGGGHGPVKPAVAQFVMWSLTVMGPRHWHDETHAQAGGALGLDRRRIGQLEREAVKGYLLEVVSRGRGRRAWRIPGPLVMLLQTPGMQIDIATRHAEAGITDAKTAALGRGTTAALGRGSSGKTAALGRGTPESMREVQPESRPPTSGGAGSSYGHRRKEAKDAAVSAPFMAAEHGEQA